MSGYGTHRWTCGECGDSYEASGVVGDSKVDRWARDHKEHHRVEKLPLEEQLRYLQQRNASMAAAFKGRNQRREVNAGT